MVRGRKCTCKYCLKAVLLVTIIALWTSFSCNFLLKILMPVDSKSSCVVNDNITTDGGSVDLHIEDSLSPHPVSNRTTSTTNGGMTINATQESRRQNDLSTALPKQAISRQLTRETGGFHQVNDEERYIYSSYLDVRFNTPYLRMFGVQEQGVVSTVHCRLHYGNGSSADFPPEVKYAIYPQWPSPKMKYLAYYYGCELPKAFMTDVFDDLHVSAFVKDSPIHSLLPVTSMGRTQERKPLAVCVKAAWGRLDPFRLVEWIETNRKLGVDKFVIYDSTVTGAAVRILEYYSEQGIVELISFTYVLNMATLMMKDPMKSQLQNEDYVLEQGYLVSINDCYYRLRDRYHFILLVDIDELLVPTNDDSLISLTRRLKANVPEASAYIFPVAWHFEEFGESTKGDVAIPEYMYMQRHLKRTLVMNPANDQPKAIINTDGAVSVNWHGVINIPANHGFLGNFNIPWKEYGYVHHFRNNCKIKYNEQECDFMNSMTEVDESIPKLLPVKDVVKQVLVDTKIL